MGDPFLPVLFAVVCVLGMVVALYPDVSRWWRRERRLRRRDWPDIPTGPASPGPVDRGDYLGRLRLGQAPDPPLMDGVRDVTGQDRELVDIYRIALDGEGWCCARAEGHEGPCAWVCLDCAGTGRCTICEHEGCPCDDVIQCGWCDGLDRCPSCDEGIITNEVR